MQTRRTTQKTNFLGYKRLNWGGGLGKIWGPGCSKNKKKGGGVAGAKEKEGMPESGKEKKIWGIVAKEIYGGIDKT